MPVRLFLASQIVRFQMRRRFAKAGDIWPLRPMMRKLAGQVPAVPGHVRLEPCVLDGVPGECLAPALAEPRAAILYVHGGAFIAKAAFRSTRSTTASRPSTRSPRRSRTW